MFWHLIHYLVVDGVVVGSNGNLYRVSHDTVVSKSTSIQSIYDSSSNFWPAIKAWLKDAPELIVMLIELLKCAHGTNIANFLWLVKPIREVCLTV